MKTLCLILTLGLLSLSQAQDNTVNEILAAADAPPVVEPATEAESPTKEEATIPEAYPINRYEASWSKNPFLLKTVAPIVQQVDWSQDWALSSMSNIGGNIRVRMVNKQTGESKRVTSEGSEDSEFRLIKANFHRNRREASVEIAKGSETATLKYDENLTSKPVTINNTLRQTGAQPGAAGNPAQRTVGGQPLKPAINPTAGRVVQPGQLGGQPGTNGIPVAPAAVGQNYSGGINGLPPGVMANQPGTNPVVIPANTVLPTDQPSISRSRRRQLIPAPVIPQ